MYIVQFHEITTSKYYFTEKAVCQNAVNTTKKTKNWKQMHHNNDYLKLLEKVRISEIYVSLAD